LQGILHHSAASEELVHKALPKDDAVIRRPTIVHDLVHCDQAHHRHARVKNSISHTHTVKNKITSSHRTIELAAAAASEGTGELVVVDCGAAVAAAAVAVAAVAVVAVGFAAAPVASAVVRCLTKESPVGLDLAPDRQMAVKRGLKRAVETTLCLVLQL